MPAAFCVFYAKTLKIAAATAITIAASACPLKAAINQYNCCKAKGLLGCWQCPHAPCGVDMHAPGKVKIRAFITCIKEEGVIAFFRYIDQNTKEGIVYHRKSIWGDYDLPMEEGVLALLRKGR